MDLPSAVSTWTYPGQWQARGQCCTKSGQGAVNKFSGDFRKNRNFGNTPHDRKMQNVATDMPSAFQVYALLHIRFSVGIVIAHYNLPDSMKGGVHVIVFVFLLRQKIKKVSNSKYVWAPQSWRGSAPRS